MSEHRTYSNQTVKPGIYGRCRGCSFEERALVYSPTQSVPKQYRIALRRQILKAELRGTTGKHFLAEPH